MSYRQIIWLVAWILWVRLLGLSLMAADGLAILSSMFMVAWCCVALSFKHRDE